MPSLSAPSSARATTASISNKLSGIWADRVSANIADPRRVLQYPFLAPNVPLSFVHDRPPDSGHLPLRNVSSEVGSYTWQFGRETQTPAMQAGLVSARMSWRDIFTAPASLYVFIVAVVRIPATVQLMNTGAAELPTFSWPQEQTRPPEQQRMAQAPEFASHSPIVIPLLRRGR